VANSQLDRAWRASRIQDCSREEEATSTTSFCRAWPLVTCCALLTPHARIRSIDSNGGEESPGRPSHIDGRGLEAFRVGRSCRSRADKGFAKAGRCIARPIRLWRGIASAGSANYVAFVVAETYLQAADASELIEVDYEP